MLVEHARTLLGVDDASHAESSSSGTSIISPLACSLDGRTVDVTLRPATRLAGLYGGPGVVQESTTCGYGLDSHWRHAASTAGLVVSAVGRGEVCAVERPDHPFFLATLYQPQLRSTTAAPHPVWLGFLRACERALPRVASADA